MAVAQWARPAGNGAAEKDWSSSYWSIAQNFALQTLQKASAHAYLHEVKSGDCIAGAYSWGIVNEQREQYAVEPIVAQQNHCQQ